MPHVKRITEEERHHRPGITFQIVIGQYGGFGIVINKNVIRICIAFISVSLFFVDMEIMIANAVNKKKI